jgi:hypothetical protein
MVSNTMVINHLKAPIKVNVMKKIFKIKKAQNFFWALLVFSKI